MRVCGKLEILEVLGSELLIGRDHSRDIDVDRRNVS